MSKKLPWQKLTEHERAIMAKCLRVFGYSPGVMPFITVNRAATIVDYAYYWVDTDYALGGEQELFYKLLKWDKKYPPLHWTPDNEFLARNKGKGLNNY